VTQPSPEPTDLDQENAARRQAIADKFRAEYARAEALACSVFGPGWKLTGRHMLLDKDQEDEARRTGTRAVPVATVITAEKGGVKRHFRVETMQECESMQAGFGEMLLEPHPTKRFTWAGKEIAPHRFSLCWGWYEPDYRPASAEKLAAARQKRQEKAVEKEAESAPLFAELIREEGYVQPKRKGTGR